MPASVYVQYNDQQLIGTDTTNPNAEADIFPLLRFVEEGSRKLTWAFAIRKRDAAGQPEVMRRNLLAASTLQAMGFLLDENPSSGNSAHLNFFHFRDDATAPIDSIADADAVFEAFPLYPGAGSASPVSDGELRVIAPALPLTIKADTALPAAPVKTLYEVKLHRPFLVDPFIFELGETVSFFNLGAVGGTASPDFQLSVALNIDPKLNLFPPQAIPKFILNNSGTIGKLLINAQKIVPNNTQPLTTVAVPGDLRHDRLTTPVATLVCLATTDEAEPFKNPSLAIEVFPAITLQPNPDLPVNVTLAQDSLRVRHFPTSGPFAARPRFKVNHLKPCLKVTVQGPTIHAEPSSGNLSEFLPLLEPAERKFDETVESINDFMTYSFEVCAPIDLSTVTLPELERLDSIGFDPLQVDWWELLKLPGKFFEFLLRFLEHPLRFSILDFELPNPRTIKLKIPSIHLLPDLPTVERLPSWVVRGIKLKATPIDIEFDAITITANLVTLTLKADFNAAVDFFEFGIQPPDFDFTLPDIGLPSLLPAKMPLLAATLLNPEPIEWELKFKLPRPVDIELLKLVQLKLKRPDGLDLKLPKVGDPTINGLNVTVHVKIDVFPIDVPRPNVDQIQVDWNFGFADLAFKPHPELPGKPDLPVLTLKLPLLEDLLPKIPNLGIDARMLKLRVRAPDFDLGSLPILKVSPDFKEITLDIELRQPDFLARLKAILKQVDVSLDISVDLNFPLTRCSLTDLLGNFPPVSFRLSMPEIPQLQKLIELPTPPVIKDLPPIRGWKLSEIGGLFGKISTPILPFELIVRLPHPSLPEPEWSELKLVLGFKFDLLKLKLLDNRIYFFLPQIREPGKAPAPRQVIDFDIFTLSFPARPPQPGLPTESNHDGYLDMTNREFVIDLIYQEPPQPPPRIYTYFPGGMDPVAARLGRAGVEELPDATEPEKIQKAKLRREYTKRFQLELDPIDPALWPEPGPHPLMFRLNGKGLTLSATLSKTEVVVDDDGFNDDGTMKTDGTYSNGLLKQFKFDPQESRGELRSRLVIIDNELREAGVYAKAEVPGVDDLIAQVSVVLRQTIRGKLPEVLASMELERADSSPLAEFSIKLLEMTLDRIALGLIWRLEEKNWDYTVIADGTVAFTGAASLVDDLEGLRAPKIKLINLDLRRMNLREMRIPLDLIEPVRFEILDGMFAVELGDLELGWIFEGKIPKPRLLACELAKLEFKNPGALEVSITVGGLHIEFDADLRAHVKLPSSLGIEVALGPTVRFSGRVGWVENEFERYLFASGKVMLEGMPEISGLLKFGTGIKTSGTPQINLVLFGEVELDEQLYPGVVVKRLGLGLGMNNQLAALPAKPSADVIIQRIDTIKPGELEGWKFVREGGFYLSIVGSVTLASNPGAPTVLNAYVAQLVVSFDTNFDLVAAGRVWLSTSLAGQLSHPDNPAFVGAMVLSPRQQKLELVLESRQNPYVEENDLIKKLLSKSRVRFEFRLTPQLVDFYLAEVSYRDNMFGVDMLFFGEYRIAIFKRAVLLKSLLSATGHIERSMSVGPGGFDLRGDAYLAVFYGGLLTDSGAMAYAGIDASISFSISAFIEIEFSKSFKICGKRISISWSIKFRASAPRLELTFRGHIALADQGGLIAVDVQIGINMNICGYRLRASGRLAINPELYEEVRNRVAAFERDLDAAVKKLDQGNDSPGIDAQDVDLGAGGDVATDAPGLGLAGIDVLQDGDLGAGGEVAADAPALALVGVAEVVAAEAEIVGISPPERWLHYRRSLDQAGKEGVSLLLPMEDSAWLTPRMSTLHGLKIIASGDVLLIAKGNSLRVGQDIHVFGARGATDTQKDLSVLNNVWAITARTDDDITINTSRIGLRGTKANVFGGMWFSPDARPGLNVQDQEGVYYQQEVERAAVVIGDWNPITAVSTVADGKITLTVISNGFVNDDRILLRRNDQSTVDYGATRQFTDKDQPNLTLKVVSATPAQIVVLLPEDLQFGPELAEERRVGPPVVGWSVAKALELAPTWSDRNRLCRLYASSEPNQEKSDYLRLTQGAAAWAGTANDADQDLAPLNRHSYQVVFDRRYESEDPRFTVEPSGSVNPPGVLSSLFLDPQSVDLVGADKVLESAIRYEQARRDLTRQELHEALDLDEHDTLRQSRAQAAQLLLHRLSNSNGIEDSDEARFVDFTKDVKDVDKGIRFGWLWKTDENLLKEIHIRRAGSVARKVESQIPKGDEKTKNVITTLVPRQDFRLDESAAIRERGRVIVKLPLRFADDFLLQNMEHLGQLQIYRRIGDSAPELIGDFIRPEISLLVQPHVYSAAQGTFVRASQNSTLIDRVTQFPGTQTSTINSTRMFEFSSEGFTNENVRQLTSSLCREVTTEEEVIVENASMKGGKVVLILAGSLKQGPGKFTCCFRAPGLIVPSPFVYSDEFAVEDRQFSDRDLVSSGFQNGRTLVTYGVRVLDEDDAGGPAANLQREFEKGRYVEWKPVPIYIPPRQELPRNLAIAIDIKDILADPISPDVTFQLVSTVGNAPSLANMDGRAFRPDEFEIWTSSTILRQSGFYATDTVRTLTDQSTADNSRLQLDDMGGTPLAESIDGKSQLTIKTSESSGRFTYKFSKNQLAIGSSYRIFLRFRGEGAGPLLVELPVLLVRQLPSQWNADVRFRRVETLELVPPEHVARFKKSVALPIPEDAFSADDLYSEGRATIRMTWQSQTVLDGGVELQFRDFDDSALTGRVLCEVLESDEFQTAYGDFSDASQWRLRHQLNRERFASADFFQPVQKPRPEDWSDYYVLPSEPGKLAEPLEVIKAASAVLTTLLLDGEKTRPITDIHWNEIAAAVEQVHRKLLFFEKSPLNYEQPLVKMLFGLTRKLLRALIVGQKLFNSVDVRPVLPQNPTPEQRAKFNADVRLLFDEASTNESSLFKLLQKLDQPISVGNGLDETATFLDRETSKRLAGIVRRRLAIANDTAILEFQDTDSPSKQFSQPELDEPLSRDSMFHRTLVDANTVASNFTLPLTEQFKVLIGDSTRKEILTTNINLWKALWHFDDKDPNLHPLVVETILNDEEFTKRIVRAAGLVDFFDKLETRMKVRETDSFAAVLKRPHHELTTTKSDAGIVAKPIPLRTLLPADVRRVEAGKLPPLPDFTTVKQTDRIGRLAVLSDVAGESVVSIWSSLGANLAEFPMQRLHEFSVGKDAASIDLDEGPDGPLLLVQGHGVLDLWDVTSSQFVKRWNEKRFGRFAQTVRGLEVLSIQNLGASVELQSLVGNRNHQFSPQEDPEHPFSGEFTVACYDDDSAVLAAATKVKDKNASLFVWRDMGRSENKTPFRTFLELGNVTVKQIETVTLPSGPRFVVLVKDENELGTDDQILMIDSENNQAIPFIKLKHRIESIAIDRRELTVAAALGDSVIIYDLVNDKVLPVPINHSSTTATILYSDYDSYLISGSLQTQELACDLITRITPDLTHPELQLLTSDLVQRLPTSTVKAVSSRLQVTRISNASKDLVSIFHLWQRMGFCLDFAVQDSKGVLLSSSELEVRAHRVLEEMRETNKEHMILVNRINGDKPSKGLHHAYYLQAEEHDAEFQPGDRVGLAFASVAIVPDEFCKAALQFDVVFLNAMLKKGNEPECAAFGVYDPDDEENTFVILNGDLPSKTYATLSSLKSALENPSESAIEHPEISIAVFTKDSDKPLTAWLEQRSLQLPSSEAERFIELAHVTHLMRLAGMPIGERVGKIHGETANAQLDRALSLGQLAVQPVAERFLTVPASAGRSHAVWSLPDHKGHRILAAVRSVSRYEPLLRWFMVDNTRRNLPEDRFLTGGTIQSVADNGTVTFASNLTRSPFGRLPLVLEIIGNPGAGQRRDATFGIDRRSLQIDPTDPWLTNPTKDSLYRVIDRSAGWRLVSIDPFHDPARGGGPQPLMVYQYPHSRTPRFSFQLPLDGMRAIYNQISRVRTGFNGIEAVFRYYLPERSIDPDRPMLLDILSATIHIDDFGTVPEFHSTAVPRGRELNVRLFRHERLVSLPELPYFYRYRVDVRSAYSSRLLEYDRVTPADLVPDDINASPPAERFPVVLGMGRSRVGTETILKQGILPADPGTTERVNLGADIDTSLFTKPWGVFLEVKEPGQEPLPRLLVKSFEAGAAILDGNLTKLPIEGWKYRLLTTHIFPLSLPVSSHRDHSTNGELIADPKPEALSSSFTADAAEIEEPALIPLALFARDLPDLLTDYRLFYLQSTGDDSMFPNRSDLFISLGTVAMPWSAEFKPAAEFPKTMPLVTLNAGLFVVANETAIEIKSEPENKSDRSISWSPKKLVESPLIVSQFGDTLPTVDLLELRPLDGDLKFGQDAGVGKTAQRGRWTKVAGTIGEVKNLFVSGDATSKRVTFQVRATCQGNVVQAMSAVFSVPLQHCRQESDVWRVQFNIASEQSNTTFSDPSRIFVQAFRLGIPSRAIPVTPTHS